jgi:hypothetical protein
MKYNVQKYVEDRKLVDEMLALVNLNGVEMLGASVFEPDVMGMLNLWFSDTIKVVLARNDAGKLIGHQMWICSSHLFKRGRIASLKTIYMLPEYRGSIPALKEFLKYGIDAMSILGFDDIAMTIDEEHASLKRALRDQLVPISTQYKFKG